MNNNHAKLYNSAYSVTYCIGMIFKYTTIMPKYLMLAYSSQYKKFFKLPKMPFFAGFCV